MRYAIIGRDGNIINIIVWDGQSEWSPPSGCAAIADSDMAAEIGGLHDGRQFHPRIKEEVDIVPAEPTDKELIATMMAEISVLRGRLEAVEATSEKVSAKQ